SPRAFPAPFLAPLPIRRQKEGVGFAIWLAYLTVLMIASREKNSLSMALPCLLAFLASSCLMGIELVAGRMMAREVGASIYSWTSVIGVILAGITAGNFAGGRIADRFEARRALGVLFFLAAVASVAIPLLDFEAGKWSRWNEPGQALSWPARIAV